jgi:hypothetical protein
VQHVWAPYNNLTAVNCAVLNGSVLSVEPEMYTASVAHPRYARLMRYLQEVERLRKELADYIFLGAWYDTLGAKVTEIAGAKVEGEDLARAPDAVLMPGQGRGFRPAPSGMLHFRVHGHRATDRRVITVANASTAERRYVWEFLHGPVRDAILHEPFEPPRVVANDAPLTIKGEGLHVLIAGNATP